MSGWSKLLMGAVMVLTGTLFVACGGADESHEERVGEAAGSGEEYSGSNGDGEGGEYRILAMGDSALDWNEDQSTPNQLGDVLGERGATATVQNNAVSGATMGCGEDGIGFADNCIPPQFAEGDWSHVLLSGGANDILESNCTVSADELITEDLSSGRVVSLVDAVTEGGHRVILYGYFRANDNGGEISSCQALYTLLNRFSALGDDRDNVLYVDAADAVTPESPEFYADEIHPSPEGSRVIAELLAERLLAW